MCVHKYIAYYVFGCKQIYVNICYHAQLDKAHVCFHECVRVVTRGSTFVETQINIFLI